MPHTPATRTTEISTAKDPQSTGLMLAETPAEELGQDLVRVQRIDLEAIARANDWQMLPYVVRLNEQNGSGFVSGSPCRRRWWLFIWW